VWVPSSHHRIAAPPGPSFAGKGRQILSLSGPNDRSGGSDRSGGRTYVGDGEGEGLSEIPREGARDSLWVEHPAEVGG